MNIHEYQAKEILREYGIPVPEGRVASTPEEAKKIASEIGGKVVVKAQIHAGGRGKGGGIKLVSSPDEAEAAAKEIIGMQLVTPQTGPQGKKSKKCPGRKGRKDQKRTLPGNSSRSISSYGSACSYGFPGRWNVY